jgi:HSP20 family protein
MWDNDFFTDFRKMQEEFDRAFGRNQRQLALGSASRDFADYYRTPVTELQETESSVVASFDMPGVDKNDIQLNVNEDSVEVKVEKKQEREEKGTDTHYYAMASRSFYRCMPLPKRINPEKALAEYKDGVLRITMPKMEKEKMPKRIAVR